MGAATEQQTEALVVKSEIHLELRPEDKVINAGKLRQFDLFRRMKKSVSIEKFPGSIILRKYRKGDVIFQQGQAGGTAFYIPTAEDLVRLKALEDGKEPPANPTVDPNRDRQVLSALIIPSTKKPRPRGVLERWFGSAEKEKTTTTKFAAIPNDGPADIDFQTREAPLLEGNLFGEMSCISFMPRSATVVSRIDCWLLEFNRNVFDQIRGDQNHQDLLEVEYRRRTLDTHLRQFELFKDLNQAQIQLLKDSVTLEVVPPGNVICEEGEKWSDSKPLDVFIVRNGVVQVIVNANLSVRMNDVRDWTGMCRLLDESQPDPKVAPAPPAPMKGSVATSAAETSAPKPLSPMERMRQQKETANVNESSPATGSPSASVSPPINQTPADPMTSMPSPLEVVRAKQAAAQAEKAATPAAVLTRRPQSEDSQQVPQVAPPAKLSPLEQMRAKQAAATAKVEMAPTDLYGTSLSETQPAEPVTLPAKLSPLEQMRAKQAATAAAKSGNAEPPPASPVVTSAEKSSTENAIGSGKPSPLEMMRAKQAAKGPQVPTTPDCAAYVLTSPEVPEEKPANTLAPVVKEFPLLRKPNANQSGPPVFIVKSWLNDHVVQAIRQVALGALQEESLRAAQSLIINALNELTHHTEFLSDKRIVAEIYSKPVILRKTGSFPKGFKGINKEWSEMELRTAGRTALSEILPNMIRRPVESAGPPRVLAYLSRGECIGEMAVVRGTERNATCIAYNHPSSENPRDFGNVELVRIRGSVFRQLMSESPSLERQVKSLAEKRLKQVESIEEHATEPDLIASAEFQQMGLFQGTKLLVIDLDSCTRCGDCVQACVDTHDDGVSRLFLDGPRYDRFLVPSACRSCLNPVCMIGCPVGSIGRGENGQIEIYDWCIGCSACADQCPYDSIQMHDLGLIPEESSGWLYANRRSLQDDWYRARRLGRGWMRGESPFRWQGDFLRQWSSTDAASLNVQSLHMCFRHEFRLPKKSRSQRYRISINDARRKGAIEKTRVKTSKVIGVWLNGEKLELSGNSIELKTEQFSRTDNVLAIEIVLDSPAEYGQFVLSACLDAISEVGTQALEVLGTDVHSEMDLVTRKAAVCDMCSHIPSQQPACVSSCPHDAAIRVNPMINFPM